MDLAFFEKRIGYKFKDREYLTIALTHASYANEVKEEIVVNERQEFLGDSVLSIVVSDYLFKHFPLQEGDLSKLRASLVCEKTLRIFADQLRLGELLQLGRGEELTGGRTRPSVLADAFEALIAAIYLDGGMEPASKFILGFVVEMLEEQCKDTFCDYKTLLQEIVQQNPEENVTYQVVAQKGPDHNKHYVVEIHLNSNVIGRGEGKNKKDAEQVAAKQALELMGQ